MTAEDYINKIVVARSAQGELQFVGICVAYCDAPTVSLRGAGRGSDLQWRADLCTVIELQDDVRERLTAILR